MAWVRILVGAVWLNGALEKLLSPSFPKQFALSLEAGGFVTAAPSWVQGLMRGLVVPNAEFVAQLSRFGELTLARCVLRAAPMTGCSGSRSCSGRGQRTLSG